MKMSPVMPFDGTLGDQEAIAVAVHLQAADGEFAAARGDGVVARTQFDQVAASGQPRQRGFQIVAARALGAELAHKLFEVRPRMRLLRNVSQKRRISHIPSFA